MRAAASSLLPRELFHQFRAYLSANDFELDTTVNGYRVLMFRRKAMPWTQVYDNDRNKPFRVAGPEARRTLNLFKETTNGKPTH